jgi:hypothetical protein
LLPAEAVQLFLQYQQDQRSQPLRSIVAAALIDAPVRALSGGLTSISVWTWSI